MNVYDFDRTIFYPDSLGLFVMRSILVHPKLWFTYFPKLCRLCVLYAFGKTSRTKVGACLFSVIAYLPDPDKDIEIFWKRNEWRISKWYLAQKKPDDLIISASPDYLIRPIAEKIGFNFVATEVDKETGVMIGHIRLAKGKSKYIIEQGMPVIDNFYSDSLSDTPIALCAERAFIVVDKARKIEPWPHINEELKKKIRKKIKID